MILLYLRWYFRWLRLHITLLCLCLTKRKKCKKHVEDVDIQRKKSGIMDIAGYQKGDQHKVNFSVFVSYINKINEALYSDVLLL